MHASYAPQKRAALLTTVSSTGWRSVGELEITRRISLVAVCCSRESARAFSRASTLASSAAFVICVMEILLRQGTGRGAVSSRQRPHFRLRLLQPVRHVHLAVHRRRSGEMLARVIPLVCSPVELAEAEVAVGDERPHADLIGERDGVTVVTG